MSINQSPSTISKKAREKLSTYTFEERNRELPMPGDLSGWESLRVETEQKYTPLCDEVKASCNPVITSIDLGGIPALEIKPPVMDHKTVIIYVHGGAFTLFSTRSSLFCSVPLAQDLGARVIAIEYPLAPHAKWETIIDQVISAIQSLREMGCSVEEMVLFGDSAGGSIAAGAALKMRDTGREMPQALVLWSPWSDISETGDTYFTLSDADPILYYPNNLQRCAQAYAPENAHRHPYVSPVYGDYSKGFPPTLIQAGTKEIFLSNAVRHYRALDDARIQVKLDLYEGMWHVFQGLAWDLPESFHARRNVKKFLFDLQIFDQI